MFHHNKNTKILTPLDAEESQVLLAACLNNIGQATTYVAKVLSVNIIFFCCPTSNGAVQKIPF